MGALQHISGILTKPQASARTEARFGRLVDGMDLQGPDLRTLPTLDEQIARLDAALGDPAEYAEAWCDIQAQLASSDGRFGARLVWHPDAADGEGPHLYCGGIMCDDQGPERRLRSDATRNHYPADDDATYRTAIIAELMLRRAYTDNRPAPRREVFNAVRGFIRNRGSIMINPHGRLCLAGCWPADHDDDRSEEQLDAAYYALRELSKYVRRQKGGAIVKRAVRIAGKSVNGFVLLEAAHV